MATGGPRRTAAEGIIRLSQGLEKRHDWARRYAGTERSAFSFYERGLGSERS
jgi:hypothetical protein